MQFDSQQYIDLFYQDADEHLESMNEALLNLERNPHDQAALQELFRSTHTIKSSSAMVGFTHISKFTHTMEDVLSQLRDSRAPITQEVVETLFQSFDVLKEMLATLSDPSSESRKNQVKRSAEQLEQKLRSLTCRELQQREGSAEDLIPRIRLTEVERSRIEEARLAGYRIYEVGILFRENVSQPSTLAVLVYNRVRSLGEVVIREPDVVRDENTGIGRGFSLIVATHASAQEIQAVSTVDQVQQVDVKDVTNVDQFEWAPEPRTGQEDGVQGKPVTVKTSFDRREDHTRGDTVRVDIEKLDRLLELVGELLIMRSRALELAQNLAKRHENGAEEKLLLEYTTQLGTIINQLQEAIIRTRMVHIGQVFARFRRVVRDLAHTRGKQVELILEGEEIELDKKIVDAIVDPLTHMIRNSIDHGIEPPAERVKAGKPPNGRLRIAVSQQGNRISIVVRDDGRGLPLEGIRDKAAERGFMSRERAERMPDNELIQVMFQPGLSTAEEVTDISGRGVGMDVVRRSVEELGGSLEINTQPGQGTTFVMRLPLTLAVTQALLVESGSEMLAIPLSSVTETLTITPQEIERVEGCGEAIRLGDSVVPVVRIDEVLASSVGRTEPDRVQVAIVKHDSRRVGLVVDGIVGEQEIVIRPFQVYGRQADFIAGASVLGDGHIVHILDLPSLLQKM